MGLPKGKTNNPNGRPKGSQNKSTKAIRDAFQMFVENNVVHFEEWIKEVAKKNPAKAIELVKDVGEYILPKLSRTEVKAEVEVKDEVDLSKLPQDVIDKLLESEDHEDEAKG